MYTIKPLSTYMSVDEFDTIWKYYGITDVAEEMKRYPIYFDHKVADRFSSFPIIYGGVVPNETYRTITDKINEIGRKISLLITKPKSESSPADSCYREDTVGASCCI
jgi:hypothetical protein